MLKLLIKILIYIVGAMIPALIEVQSKLMRHSQALEIHSRTTQFILHTHVVSRLRLKTVFVCRSSPSSSS